MDDFPAHRSLPGFVTALVCAALGGCASSDPAAVQTTPSPALDAGDASGNEVPCDDGPELDMTGLWAALARFSLRLQSQTGGVITVCPAGQAAYADMLLFLRIDAGSAPGDLQLTAWPCSMTLPSVSAVVGDCRPDADNLLTTEIGFPDALLSAFPSIPVETVSGAVQGSSAGAPFSFDRFHFTWGSRKPTDQLPAWQLDVPGCGLGDFAAGHTQQCEPSCVKDCADVLDDDGDGYPGVTLHVCGTVPDDVASNVACRAEAPNEPGVTLQGLLSMVVHTELQLEGTARSSCLAVAQFDSQTLYSVVGADAYLANTKVSVASAIKSLPLFDAVNSESSLRMIRIDGLHGAGDWGLDPASPVTSCALVRQRRNDLQ